MKLLKAQARMLELAEYQTTLQMKLQAAKQATFKFKNPGDVQMANASAEDIANELAHAQVENQLMQEHN